MTLSTTCLNRSELELLGSGQGRPFTKKVGVPVTPRASPSWRLASIRPARRRRARSSPAHRPAAGATPTPAPRHLPGPRRRAAHRSASCVGVLPPGSLVVAGLVQVELAEAPLGFLHDAAALGDLRRVVGLPHFVMEQLAARVPQQLLQL